jgi:hypothetical protein
VRKQWGLQNEEEEEYRRKLLLRAKKGDVKAQAELMEKFAMRVYSDTERSKMPSYYDSGKKGSPPSLTSNNGRTSTRAKSTPSQGMAKRSAEAKNRAKMAAQAKKK